VELVTSRARAATGVVVAFLVCAAGACGGGGSGPETATTGAPSSTTAPSASVRAAAASWTLPAPVAREVVVASGSRFTVVGGLDATKFSTASIVTVDPTTGNGQPAGALAEAVHDAAGVRAGSRVLVFGGGGPSEDGTADVQGVAANGTSHVVGGMPGPRSDLVAARVGGATYVFGGYDGATIVPDILRTTDGTTFTTVGRLPVPVRYPALAVVGTAVYLFGGVSNSEQGVDTVAVQRFDTRSGTIDTVAHLPTSLSHASAVVLGGHVYLLGGYVGDTQLSDQILRFDPATGAVAAAGRLPAPISDAAAVVVDGKGYLVGGQGADRAPRATVTIVTAS
jgi:hypothetical protein